MFKSAFSSGPNIFCVVSGPLGVNCSLHTNKNTLHPSHMETENVHAIRETQGRDVSHWSLEKIVELNIQRIKILEFLLGE